MAVSLGVCLLRVLCCSLCDCQLCQLLAGKEGRGWSAVANNAAVCVKGKEPMQLLLF